MTFVEKHRVFVGGLWEEMGKLQFDFLVSRGLRPHHHFLDVGCGCLRGGRHYIQFLDEGHYCRLDISSDMLDAALNIELPRYNLAHKKPVLLQSGEFGFSRFGRLFDFAIAQSVFTHIPIESINQCLTNIGKVLKPGAKFYATIFECPKGYPKEKPFLHPKIDGPDFESYSDRDPYHYEFGSVAGAGTAAGLKATYIGEWKHPRDQRMVVFEKL